MEEDTNFENGYSSDYVCGGGSEGRRWNDSVDVKDLRFCGECRRIFGITQSTYAQNFRTSPMWPFHFL